MSNPAAPSSAPTSDVYVTAHVSEPVAESFASSAAACNLTPEELLARLIEAYVEQRF
jgi:hypothetical protein